MLNPRDIDIELEDREPRKARNEEGEGRPESEGRGGGEAYIDTLTEPLMYVIDLLCDALALRVPDRLSSGPDARGSQ